MRAPAAFTVHQPLPSLLGIRVESFLAIFGRFDGRGGLTRGAVRRLLARGRFGTLLGRFLVAHFSLLPSTNAVWRRFNCATLSTVAKGYEISKRTDGQGWDAVCTRPYIELPADHPDPDSIAQCRYATRAWPTRKLAESRIAEHHYEHDEKQLMRPIARFIAEEDTGGTVLKRLQAEQQDRGMAQTDEDSFLGAADEAPPSPDAGEE